MKLLVFSPYFWPHKGGHEKYVQELCSRLAKNWKITIVTAQLAGMKTEELFFGMRILRVPSWNILGETYPVPKPTIFKLLRQIPLPDVIITNTRFFPLSAIAARFARKKKIPLLHIEHGTMHPPVRIFLRPLVLLYDHTIGKFVFKSATVVAGVSHAAEQFVKHVCNRTTTTLYNAIDTVFFHHKLASPRRPVITFVGRLIEAKGVQDLLEATRDLAADVWIIGAGNFEQTLRKLAGKNVKFLGEKTPAQVRELLAQSTLFVNPSYNEGLPTSVLEAGSLGLPVIATDVGGTCEIIDDGVNGYLAKPHDANALRTLITSTLDNSACAFEQGKMLQKKIRTTFDWKTIAAQADKLLRSLVKP
ncbi:MAG TPA: glycosyltransferase family 4 protein [Candidatus Nanoarchaeia archaeon]|nr:glycosyltransferase family 4 protein [Candidatus Nanoarchaeia archaeon]